MVRRYILGAVVDSEKNYVDALQRILEVPEHQALSMFVLPGLTCVRVPSLTCVRVLWIPMHVCLQMSGDLVCASSGLVCLHTLTCR